MVNVTRFRTPNGIKAVIRIPKDKTYTVNQAYYDIPLKNILEDEYGRKHVIRIPVVSQNGRHVICRDLDNAKDEMYFDNLPVDKIVMSDYEYRIHLRKVS